MDKSAIGGYNQTMAETLGIFFDPEVQRLIDSFAYCFKVKITVFSPDMEELVVGLQNPGARYCRMVQNGLKIRYRCCRQDAQMCESCRERDRLTVYRCHAGLSEAVLPMRLDGKLVGYAMIGQFRMTGELPAEMRSDWIKAGFDPKDLAEAFQSQSAYDRTALNNMLNLFTMMITFVISRDYVRIRRVQLVEEVIKWIDLHIDEIADLGTVSNELNKSPSTISHAVKKQLGLSFKQLASLKKIQKFESLIARDPNLSIQEAAARVGYSDPLYFSRLYKKIRLSPPSTYAQSFRGSTVREEGFVFQKDT